MRTIKIIKSTIKAWSCFNTSKNIKLIVICAS